MTKAPRCPDFERLWPWTHAVTACPDDADATEKQTSLKQATSTNGQAREILHPGLAAVADNGVQLKVGRDASAAHGVQYAHVTCKQSLIRIRIIECMLSVQVAKKRSSQLDENCDKISICSCKSYIHCALCTTNENTCVCCSHDCKWSTKMYPSVLAQYPHIA